MKPADFIITLSDVNEALKNVNLEDVGIDIIINFVSTETWICNKNKSYVNHSPIPKVVIELRNFRGTQWIYEVNIVKMLSFFHATGIKSYIYPTSIYYTEYDKGNKIEDISYVHSDVSIDIIQEFIHLLEDKIKEPLMDYFPLEDSPDNN